MTIVVDVDVFTLDLIAKILECEEELDTIKAARPYMGSALGLRTTQARLGVELALIIGRKITSPEECSEDA